MLMTRKAKPKSKQINITGHVTKSYVQLTFLLLSNAQSKSQLINMK